MSVSGRISIDALFHDTDGSAINVVSLSGSDEYDEELFKVAIITGTAGASQTTVSLDGVYRDASGNLVSIGDTRRILFSWSSEAKRRLELVNFDDFVECALVSRSNEIATSTGTQIQEARLTASSGNTGTYRIVVYGR